MSTHDKNTELEHSDVPAAFEDPGLPEHRYRMGDTDPAANKRSERQVVVLFAISVLGAVGALVAYFALPLGSDPMSVRWATLGLGLGLALSLLGIGTGAVHWAKTLMSDHEVTEKRKPISSDQATRDAAVQALVDGARDSAIARRGVLKGAVLSALAIFPLTIAVPLIGSVGGDWNISKFRHTVWRKGRRLALDPSGRPIKASDVTVGSVFHVIPDGMRDEEHWMEEKAKAVVLLVRLDERDLKGDQSPSGETWSYDGIVAYSKICTHVGCPVALYEQQTHHLLCPCHQSTFDIADGAKVVFGPANRPLPQLPITVDAEGYLVAQDDFAEPIGPSFWERLK
ncbi:ubiquinol-cytochrome c reductase iron-sulfur subunit [Sanguibacter massiliensis]|uniref:cytochrome bc1 complex Rieske iron-sulfur subunit n=1 Tax=Sanguibacter massiliensis TaxID=1973217 RepID=UPI001F5DA86C|nr:Rieske 2Fe-2S domain-containing protein [Sanguibacter massiliensis]